VRIPEPPYQHLFRLSDDTGLLEHACGMLPRREEGYCLDDNARGLALVSRAAPAPSRLGPLAERYLAFIAHAQAPDGRCRNRLGYDRRWEDEPGLGDWWGRALWGLGVAAAHHPDAALRHAALTCFQTSARCRSAHPRAMIFAALGAAEVSRAHPGHTEARGLLTAVAELGATTLRPAEDPAWPWPQDRLTYGNATLPEALIVTGRELGDASLQAAGLELLGWLLEAQTRDGHLSPVGVHGLRRGDGAPAPAFDQQPIEVAALASACAEAFALTGEAHWHAGVEQAVGWFLGDNDLGTVMYDPSAGGGYDGLTPSGPNLNQGAESTLAFLATLQVGRRLAPALSPAGART
jgi:hypothetical protein